MRSLALSLFALTAACAGDEAADTPDAAAVPALEALWVADGFSAPEGVAPAPGGGYFISNVAGEGAAKDGEGWIARVSEDGAVLAERFAQGLDAPKGMALLDDTLYVADIDQVRLIDAATGDLKGAIAIDGAQFLNDATVWRGAVYVSDSAGARIHRLENGEATVWLEDAERLGGVNGLLGDGDTLYISTMTTGSLFAADAGGNLREIATGMINADGIGLVPGGGWLVSSWPGEIHFVAPDGTVTQLIDTRDEEILQNDLTMFGDMVIVPNWRPGTVTAWRAKR